MPLLRLPSYPPLSRRPGVHMEWSAPPWFVSVGDHGSDKSHTQQREHTEANTRACSVNVAWPLVCAFASFWRVREIAPRRAPTLDTS